MAVEKSVYTTSMGVISTVLAGLVLFDIYDDAILRGYGLQSALVENIVPLLFVAGLLYAIAWVHTAGDQQHAAMMAQWMVLGLGGFVLITGWITAIQLLEQELQPIIVLTHTAIGGAVAGVLIGYGTAERNQARRTVQREKERFESLFRNDPAGVADVRYTDGTLCIERANPAFEQAFAGGDGATGTNLFDLLDIAESGPAAEIPAHIDDREVYEGSATVQREDGNRYFTLRVAPYSTDGESTRAYAIFDDVTELEETRLELEENVKELEQSNERLQQFAYIASHDLQEPARMVSSYMRLLEEEYGDELDEEAGEYMEFAADGADRMRAMIDGLLAYSRVRRQAEPMTDVDADDVLAETLQDLEARLDETDATVTSESLPAVQADRSQLGQVFQNLIENAVEHGSTGSRTSSDDAVEHSSTGSQPSTDDAVDHGRDGPEIHVGCRRNEDAFVFSVADDGRGIPESQQEKIFELFKQGSRDDEGTGIGLAICDRIVSRHDGDIWVESRDGDGATFYFSIPR